MNKSILKGTLLGGLPILIFAVLAVGGYKVLHRPKVAEVVAVKEVTETVMTRAKSVAISRCDSGLR